MLLLFESQMAALKYLVNYALKMKTIEYNRARTFVALFARYMPSRMNELNV